MVKLRKEYLIFPPQKGNTKEAADFLRITSKEVFPRTIISSATSLDYKDGKTSTQNGSYVLSPLDVSKTLEGFSLNILELNRKEFTFSLKCIGEDIDTMRELVEQRIEAFHLRKGSSEPSFEFLILEIIDGSRILGKSEKGEEKNLKSIMDDISLSIDYGEIEKIRSFG